MMTGAVVRMRATSATMATAFVLLSDDVRCSFDMASTLWACRRLGVTRNG